MDTNAQMERLFAGVVHQILIRSDARCLERLRRDVFFLPADQMDDIRKLVDGRFLHTHVVDTYLRVRHTATVSRFWIRTALDLTIATRRTTTHDGAEEHKRNAMMR